MSRPCQNEGRDQARFQVGHAGDELVGRAGLRVDVADAAHDASSVEADQFMGLDSLVNRGVRVPWKVVVDDRVQVGFGSGDDEGAVLFSETHLEPELFVDESRGPDEDRASRGLGLSLLFEPINQTSAKDGELMTVLAVALDGAQVHEQSTVQVEGVAWDEAAFAIPRGVAGMLQLMSVDGVDGPVPQFRESGEKILTWITASDIGACDQESIEFTQQILTPRGMQRIEESGAAEGFAKVLGALLKEIPTTDRLAENAQDAQANKVWIGDNALGAHRSDITVQERIGGCEQLVE